MFLRIYASPVQGNWLKYMALEYPLAFDTTSVRDFKFLNTSSIVDELISRIDITD